VAIVALMFGVASIASAQHSSGIMGSGRDGPVKVTARRDMTSRTNAST
jgi:hypothetical protein